MLNPNKTLCIFIGNRQLLAHVLPITIIRIDGDIIAPNAHVKNLDVYMGQLILYDKYTDVLTKVVGVLMFLSRISADLDKSSRIIVVQSLFLSTINYYMKVWAIANMTLINKS